MAEVEELANFFNIKLNKEHMTNVSNWLDPETSSGWRGAARDFCFVFKFYFTKLQFTHIFLLHFNYWINYAIITYSNKRGKNAKIF